MGCMNKYSLERFENGTWKLVKDYASLSGAVRASRGFIYRIINRTSGEIVNDNITNDTLHEMQHNALASFRLNDVISTAVERLNSRRSRLARFAFVGEAPVVPDDDGYPEKESLPKEITNWLIEGF